MHLCVLCWDICHKSHFCVFLYFTTPLYSIIVQVMPRQAKKETWRSSKAKEILRDAIIRGLVNKSMTPEEVYESHDEYKKWPKRNFKTNFKNLCTKVSKDKARSCYDAAAYEHDRALLCELRGSNKTSSQWNLSDAKHLLRQDIEEGKHFNMRPRELYGTCKEYQDFDLKTFRKHIYQEKARTTKIATGSCKKRRGL